MAHSFCLMAFLLPLFLNVIFIWFIWKSRLTVRSLPKHLLPFPLRNLQGCRVCHRWSLFLATSKMTQRRVFCRLTRHLNKAIWGFLELLKFVACIFRSGKFLAFVASSRCLCPTCSLFSSNSDSDTERKSLPWTRLPRGYETQGPPCRPDSSVSWRQGLARTCVYQEPKSKQ